MVDKNWRTTFDHELDQAEAARREGNEGKARVCARRAAGIAIGEYLARQGEFVPGSAYARIQALASRPATPPELRAVCAHLLLRITPDHELPVEADLIAETRRLGEALLGGEAGQTD